MRIKDNTIKGIYIIPNLLTTMALFSGFYAIIAAISGHFGYAAMAIFIGLIFDGLDGRVARLINSQSDFGAMYDSLSDVMVFGLAPALIAYLWGLRDFGKIGWLISFYYAAATALRLARFNSQLEDGGASQFFKGLPCPMAASLLVSFIWVCHSYGYSDLSFKVTVAVLAFFSASLMLSNIRYYSFKNFDARKKVPFLWGAILLLIIVVIFLHPPITLFSIAIIYTLAGIIYTLQAKKYKKTILK